MPPAFNSRAVHLRSRPAPNTAQTAPACGPLPWGACVRWSVAVPVPRASAARPNSALQLLPDRPCVKCAMRSAKAHCHPRSHGGTDARQRVQLNGKETLWGFRAAFLFLPMRLSPVPSPPSAKVCGLSKALWEDLHRQI